LSQSGACIAIHPEHHIIIEPLPSDLDRNSVDHPARTMRSSPYSFSILAFKPRPFDHQRALPFPIVAFAFALDQSDLLGRPSDHLQVSPPFHEFINYRPIIHPPSDFLDLARLHLR